MTEFHTKFCNEIGHEIQLSITRPDAETVIVQMAGPDSMMENEITPMEARELRDALEHVLQKEASGLGSTQEKT